MARPRGAKDKAPRITAARKQAETAAAEGLTPLDVMLRAMRRSFELAEATEALARDEATPDDQRHTLLAEAEGYYGVAVSAAKDAAPYVHPRLAAVQHSGDADAPVFVMALPTAAEDFDQWEKQHRPTDAE